MTVASPELCRELYELSGWENLQYAHYKSEREYIGLNEKQEFYGGHIWIAPAYDLGYLLRKLPEVHEDKSGVRWILKLEVSGGKWMCYYDGNLEISTADTPEDAAAKLAIELFKQGVLSKEASHAA